MPNKAYFVGVILVTMQHIKISKNIFIDWRIFLNTSMIELNYPLVIL